MSFGGRPPLRSGNRVQRKCCLARFSFSLMKSSLLLMTTELYSQFWTAYLETLSRPLRKPEVRSGPCRTSQISQLRGGRTFPSIAHNAPLRRPEFRLFPEESKREHKCSEKTAEVSQNQLDWEACGDYRKRDT